MPLKLSLKQKEQFYQELAKFVESGFGFDRACQSIAELGQAPQLHRTICRSIRKHLESGESISEAMRKASPSITALEWTVVEAAERGGVLEKGLRRLAEYFHRLRETRQILWRNMLYPVAVLHMAVVLGVVTTKVAGAFQGDGPSGAAGAFAFLTDAGSGILLWLAILYLLCAIFAVVIGFIFQQGQTSLWADRLLQRIPVIGGARRYLALSRFTEAFSAGVTAGQKMSRSLRGAAAAAQSAVIGKAGNRIAKAAEEGKPIGDAFLAQGRAFPGDFCRSIHNAELAGALDKDLERWSREFDERATAGIKAVAVWLPRILYGGVVCVVIFVVIRFALTYYGAIQGILDMDPY